MDLKDAVDLYRDVLQRYSEGFSLEGVLGSIAEAIGGRCAVLFVRREMSSFLEAQLAWNMLEAERERINDNLLPVEWIARQPVHHYVIISKENLSELGLAEICNKPTDIVLLFPVRSHSHLRAALLVAVARESSLPDQQSFKTAAIGAVLERVVELFSFDDRSGRLAGEDEQPPLELGILSSYLIGKADYARAASLSLDLLVKLLNLDGGTVHRVKGEVGEQQATLVASRGWGGMPEIVEHLFENRLIEFLQTMHQSGENEFGLDAGRIEEYFPGVKPLFHANQVKSFMLTPIFHEDGLVGLLTLFGKAYTAMEPRDMELLVQLSQSLGTLFSSDGPGARSSKTYAKGWDFPALIDDLAHASEEALSVDDFLASALRVISVDLGVAMSFVYAGEELNKDRSFQWYADAIYGGESIFKSTLGLERVSSHLHRMVVVKSENPAMKEMPAAEQAIAEGFLLLLVPARERNLFLLTGFYLPGESKLTKAEVDSLQPLATVLLGMVRGLRERAQTESYRRALEILTEIEGDLAACDDHTRILRILARGGKELLHCDRAAIVVVDEDEGSFEGAVETQNGEEAIDLSLLTSREISAALERGHALYAANSEGYEAVAPMGEGSRSFIAVPLIGRKGRLGALVFEKEGQEDYFGEFQKRLAHFLAGQAVSVLESQKEGTKLESASEENRALLRISRRLSSSLTLEEMCGGLYREFENTLGMDLFLLSVYGKSGVRRLAWLKGERDDIEAYDELLEAHGPLMLAVSRGGKLIRNNLNTFLRGPGEDGLALKGIRSYMAAALQGEDMKGLILVGSTRGGALTERSVALIEKSAGLVNSSISIPSQHEVMRSRIRLLEEMCRTEEEKVQTKTDLINMASHEIRHPLTLIMGFSEVLRDYGDSLDAQESRAVMDKLGKAADRLRRSVVNMMEISHLESGKLALDTEEVDLSALIGGLVEELQARSVEHIIEVDLERGTEKIIADRDKLEIILFNLMDNAAKYSPPAAAISIFARRTSREVLIGVRDQGQGISEEHLDAIFKPFRQGEGKESGPIKGMGLGLYIVNRLVEAHGGRIEVRSEHGKGSTFIAHIPQAESGKEGFLLNDDALRA